MVERILIFMIFALLVFIIKYEGKMICKLEENVEKVKKVKNEEFLDILIRLKEYQNFDIAGRDTCTRRLIDESIEQFSSENRQGD